MDFAFAPGVDDYYGLARQLLTNRPGTQLIQGRNLKTVANFIDQLEALPATQKPAGELFITSHGTDEAWMQIPLDNTQVHGSKSDPTTYEVAVAAVASGSVKIPSDVNHDSEGNLTSASVNIRGCRIGASTPFADKLKEAFGNESPVTAPRHLHHITPLPIGMVEYLEYAFVVNSKTAFASKAAVVTAFSGRQPAFTFRDGTTPVDPALWTDWVPKNVSRGERVGKYLFLKLGQTVGAPPHTQTQIRGATEFRHTQPPPYTYRIGLPGMPPAADRLDTLRQALKNDAANAGSLFDSAYPLPVYQRWGQSSIDDFVDNLAWTFSWDAGNSRMICAGTQHQYMVIAPITDPPDLSTGTLIYNFYPPQGSGGTAVDQLLTSDSTLFYTA